MIALISIALKIPTYYLFIKVVHLHCLIFAIYSLLLFLYNLYSFFFRYLDKSSLFLSAQALTSQNCSFHISVPTFSRKRNLCLQATFFSLNLFNLPITRYINYPWLRIYLEFWKSGENRGIFHLCVFI